MRAAAEGLPMTDLTSTRTSAVPHHFRVFGSFFFYAVVLGSLFPRLGDVQLAMGVGEAALGLGLLGAALGTQVSLTTAGNLIERVGHRATLILGVAIIGAGQIAATFAPGIPTFFLCLFLAGLAIGCVEIVVNLEADRAEHQLGRRIMSRAHAFWSFGFFTAGLLGSFLAQRGLPPWMALLIVDTVAVLMLAWLLAGFRAAPPRVAVEGPGPRFVAPTAGILALVVYTLSAMLLEGALIDWSVIYMRDTFDVSPLLNGLALTIGALAQGITRFFADSFVDRWGPVRVARVQAVILGLGAAIVAFSPDPYLSLAGFLLIGVGAASAFPLAMSAAAQRTDRAAQANVASLAQLSFVVFLLAPPILGFVAEHFGIRVSFGIGLPLVVLTLLFTHHLAPRRP
jgi:MFS family permease